MSGKCGRTLRLSLPRRFIGDLMHASRGIPLIPFERTMELAEVAAARNSWPGHPTWYALFVRAFALVAAQRPELRRVYVSYPWPRLYEYPVSIASFSFERRWDGEDAVLIGRIDSPEDKSVGELDAVIRSCKERPLDELSAFRRIRRMARLPLPVRRLGWGLLRWLGKARARELGTFGISATAGLGASALTLVTPCTSTLNYDRLQPDGRMAVRLIFDHRVYDGATAARALTEIEEVLHGQILAELRSQVREAA
jgi:hypothetical protein